MRLLLHCTTSENRNNERKPANTQNKIYYGLLFNHVRVCWSGRGNVSALIPMCCLSWLPRSRFPFLMESPCYCMLQVRWLISIRQLQNTSFPWSKVTTSYFHLDASCPPRLPRNYFWGFPAFCFPEGYVQKLLFASISRWKKGRRSARKWCFRTYPWGNGRGTWDRSYENQNSLIIPMADLPLRASARWSLWKDWFPKKGFAKRLDYYGGI